MSNEIWGNPGIVVGAIAIICYLIAEAVKASKKIDNKWLPTICGVFGGMLGIAGMYVMTEFPGNDVITSFAIGIFSGLSATGVNQVFKQLGK